MRIPWPFRLLMIAPLPVLAFVGGTMAYQAAIGHNVHSSCLTAMSTLLLLCGVFGLFEAVFLIAALFGLVIDRGYRRPIHLVILSWGVLFVFACAAYSRWALR